MDLSYPPFATVAPAILSPAPFAQSGVRLFRKLERVGIGIECSGQSRDCQGAVAESVTVIAGPNTNYTYGLLIGRLAANLKTDPAAENPRGNHRIEWPFRAGLTFDGFYPGR